jgi:hypothetical protein
MLSSNFVGSLMLVKRLQSKSMVAEYTDDR